MASYAEAQEFPVVQDLREVPLGPLWSRVCARKETALTGWGGARLQQIDGRFVSKRIEFLYKRLKAPEKKK